MEITNYIHTCAWWCSTLQKDVTTYKFPLFPIHGSWVLEMSNICHLICNGYFYNCLGREIKEINQWWIYYAVPGQTVLTLGQCNSKQLILSITVFSKFNPFKQLGEGNVGRSKTRKICQLSPLIYICTYTKLIKTRCLLKLSYEGYWKVQYNDDVIVLDSKV